MVTKLFRARYPRRCDRCGGEIAPGDLITYTSLTGTRCEACSRAKDPGWEWSQTRKLALLGSARHERERTTREVRAWFDQQHQSLLGELRRRLEDAGVPTAVVPRLVDSIDIDAFTWEVEIGLIRFRSPDLQKRVEDIDAWYARRKGPLEASLDAQLRGVDADFQHECDLIENAWRNLHA